MPAPGKLKISFVQTLTLCPAGRVYLSETTPKSFHSDGLMSGTLPELSFVNEIYKFQTSTDVS